MKKSQLSDKQLEEILGQMPKIKDHRDSRDIYQNIAHRVEKRKKMPTWVIPGAALAAVLFLAFILSPGLMGNNYSEDKSMDSSAVGEKSSMEMNTATSDDTANESASQKESTFMMESADSKVVEKNKEFAAMDKANPYDGLISLYSEEVDTETSEVLTYAIPDKQAMTVVPVTVTTPKKNAKAWIDSYAETMSKLKEEEWGLSDYYPLDAKWSSDGENKTLSMDVKENHNFKYGSSASTNFKEAMTQNFSGKGFEKLLLFTEGNKGILLEGYGTMDEMPISAEQSARRAYLFLLADGIELPYLVPTKEKFETIEFAFEQMLSDIDEQNLTASIPGNIKLDYTEKENSVLSISLGEVALDDSFLPHLEAILLTAKEFNYKGVKIENANIEQLGPFNLNEVLPLPIAPNKKNID
ncbi:hypothetical protein DYI25_09835 [Mesobacillus boroniphilus]|uniref:Sigma-X negative effector n=1 Tax=Mesobacillus boroniphilus TaxID=308892 RepID=A0A944CLH5_9BACI|nr:hypothetical protein [Mesobacillus boroniphilus]MBS8264737.1 hypothetical protein [Mesobacillus boroniphilus]